MKLLIRSILLLLLIGGSAFAQTAALLPPAISQFLDNNGNPLSAGTVTTYIVGTSTLKTTWKDAAETIPNTNPIILDAGGKATIYGDGNYRQVLRDRLGNLIWDAPTSAFGAGGPNAFGDGAAIGNITTTSAITAPLHYAFAYGQELSRVTYSVLYAAITISTTASCSSGNATLSGFSDTTQIPIGAAVEASCIPAGSVVISTTGTTITLNNNATVSTSVTARIFMYGNGNGTTTFNVPDLRGRALAGRDNMGGTAATRLTSTYFAAPGTGANGGTQVKTFVTANLPPYTPTGTIAITDPGHTHALSESVYATGATTLGAGSAGATLKAVTATSSVTGVTAVLTGTAQGGTSSPFSIVQPTITLNYIIKILPDINATTPLPIFPDPLEIDGTVLINPVVNTTNQGIVINQTSPNAGTTASEIHFNSVTVNDGLNVTPGLGSSAFYIEHNLKANSNGQKFGLYINSQHQIATNSSNDQIAGVFFAQTGATAGGTNTGAGAQGGIYGGNAIVSALSGGTNYQIMAGFEADVDIHPGATTQNRFGIAAASGNTVKGVVRDAAFVVYASSGGFDNFLLASNIFGTPLSATACMMCTDSAFTVGKGIDLTQLTITGDAFAGPNLSRISGAGVFSASDATATIIFNVSSLFTHSGQIGTNTNHNLVFLQNNMLAGYFDTNKALNLGFAAISQGALILNGLTSGSVTIAVQAAAGTFNFNLPTTAGTSGQVLASAGGAGAPMTWTTPSCTTTCVTSAASLTVNAIVIGGGGQAVSTTTTGLGVLTALSNNTGTANSFVVFNSALGTPSSGTLTNATGLPISTGVSGLGSGIATWLGTPSTANFASAITGALSTTKTVRAAGGAADCTLIFTGGLLTGGSC